MTTHSSVLAWKIPWTGEPGGLTSTGLRRTLLSDSAHTDKKRSLMIGCVSYRESRVLPKSASSQRVQQFADVAEQTVLSPLGELTAI